VKNLVSTQIRDKFQIVFQYTILYHTKIEYLKSQDETYYELVGWEPLFYLLDFELIILFRLFQFFAYFLTFRGPEPISVKIGKYLSSKKY